MQKYLKAIYGAAVAALGSVGTAYVAQGDLTWQVIVPIAITFLGALGVIWGVPNSSATPK